jgi:hypothetical protein
MSLQIMKYFLINSSLAKRHLLKQYTSFHKKLHNLYLYLHLLLSDENNCPLTSVCSPNNAATAQVEPGRCDYFADTFTAKPAFYVYIEGWKIMAASPG